MAFLYPELPQYTQIDKNDTEKLYQLLLSYAGELKFLLEARDEEIQNTPATKVLTVVTIASIGRPANGDIVFATSAGKYRGFVSGTGWVDFH